MKRIFILFATALLACSCGHKNAYTIDGHLGANDLEGKKIYMFDINNQLIDSTTISNGLFSFTGDASQPAFVTLMSEPSAAGGQYGMRLILEPGTIYADIFADSLSGTPLNEDYYQFLNDKSIAALGDQLQQLLVLHKTTESDLEKATIERQYDSIAIIWNKALLDKAEQTLADHPKDILGAYAFCMIASQSDPTNGRPTMDAATLRQRMEKLPDVIVKFPPTQDILHQLESMNVTAEGQTFVDFEGIDFATGEKSSLSKMIAGKVAIVDFWASWCGPCRQEIKEHLIDLHKKYASKGVVVLGVDISDTPEKHRAAVEELGINYPQLRVEDDKAAKLYNITGIPHIMLIAADGTIVARDLRGPAIEEALKKVL